MKDNIENKIDKLTSAISLLLSREVAPVAPVAPVEPVEPVKPLALINPLDHDTLISFRAETIQELKAIRSDIAKLSDNTGKQINDHEMRINDLEKMTTRMWSYGVACLFILGVVEFVLSKVIK